MSGSAPKRRRHRPSERTTLRLPGGRVLVAQHAADERRHLEHAEVRARHVAHDELLGLAGAGQTRARLEVAVRGQRVKGVRVAQPAVIEDWRDRVDVGRVRLVVRLPDFDEAVGVRVGQRLQHQLPRHREDGGVRAKTERKRQNGGQRKSWLPPDGPQSVPNVAQHMSSAPIWTVSGGKRLWYDRYDRYDRYVRSEEPAFQSSSFCDERLVGQRQFAPWTRRTCRTGRTCRMTRGR